MMLTPKLDPNADNALSEALRERLGRPVDLHVDQLKTSLDSSGVEAAQISRANTAGNVPQVESRERAASDLALIAGIKPADIQVGQDGRSLSATAAPLVGLGMDGYHALEGRAMRALPRWEVTIAPPETVAPPNITIDEGVVDGRALDVAAWGAARLGRTLQVDGGTRAQRQAVVNGIIARGGDAEPGGAGQNLTLTWAPKLEMPIAATGREMP